MGKKKEETECLASRQPQDLGRRKFLKQAAAGACLSLLSPFTSRRAAASTAGNPLFWITDIPDQPFLSHKHPNYHSGVESLLYWMGRGGLKFYRSMQENAMSGPMGLIEAQDVVLIKVNAQWKYRGCTNSDVIRGLIQRILNHPDGFQGEVVIIENGQARGSFNCDTGGAYGGDTSVHANANDESHTFLYLVNQLFRDERVSLYLLDPIREVMISGSNHAIDGYRIFENVSYPCFTTSKGNRVELREGIWQGNGYSQNLKLINVPVIKHHDENGSEITAALKNFYGVVSMADGQVGFRHYAGLGETCGKMVAFVRTPVLNIIDAIWVSHGSLAGYPAGTTFRANQLLASQDPVALDYYAAKYILCPIDYNFRHHPNFPGIVKWLADAESTINNQGGLYTPTRGILIDRVTRNEQAMSVIHKQCRSTYHFHLRIGA